MAELPRYLNLVKPTPEGQAERKQKKKKKGSKKRPRSEAGEGQPSAASPAKKAHHPPSSPVLCVGSRSTEPVAKDKGILPSDSPMPPSPSRGPLSPPTAPKIVRGLAWEKGVSPELELAFLPPRQFMNAVPLADIDERVVHEVQARLCQGIGLAQAFLHLKGKYVGQTAEVRRLRVEKEEADEWKQKVGQELEVAQASAGKATEELLLTKEAYGKVTSELSSLQEAYMKSMDAVKVLQSQRADLCSELSQAKSLFEDEKKARLEAEDIVREAAQDCFKMALAQIRHLNPGLDINTVGYDYRAYVKDGVLHAPPPSSSDEESVSLTGEEPDREGAPLPGSDVGEGSSRALPEVASDDVVPPS